MHPTLNQQVFDHIVTHLLTQNERAEEGDECRYRLQHLNHIEPLMCAAGCLILPHHYDPNFEGLLVTDPRVWSAVYKSILEQFGEAPDKDTENTVYLCQYIHDSHPTTIWWKKLREMAKHNNLTFNPPKDP